MMAAPDLAPSLPIQFLQAVYATAETGWVTVFTVAGGKRETGWAPVGDIDQLSTFIATRVATHDMWFGVAARADHLEDGRRGGARDCTHLVALCVDADFASDAHAIDDSQLPADATAARALIDAFPLPPTAIVHSGHGLQPWWVLAEPAASADAEPLLARWAATWARMAADAGVHLDNVFDLARVMRLPGSLNHKGDPIPVRLIDADWSRCYGLDDIDQWLDDAQPPPAPATRRQHPYIGPDRPGDAFNIARTAAEVLTAAGWTQVGRADRNGDTQWHRPGSSNRSGATVYADDGHTTVWSDRGDLPVRRPMDVFGLYTHICHRGDWRAASEALRDAGYGKQRETISAPPTPYTDDGRYAPDDGLDEEPAPSTTAQPVTVAPHAPETPAGGEDEPSEHPVLPDAFWDAREALGHIRQAARSRLIAPDALFGAVLARVSLHTDHRLILPALVGRTGSLNLTVGIVGASGSGKGSVADESAVLVGPLDHGPDHVVGEAPAGSGEGIVRTFFDSRKDPDDKRRTMLVKTRHAMLIRVDEGEALQKLGARQGQTTWQTLRQAFSGEALGGSYMDDSKRCRLDPHTYRLALLMAIQPELAQFIFDDVVGGTPQRFVYLAAVDPAAPELEQIPEHPGPLRWSPPLFTSRQVDPLIAAGPDGLRRATISVDPAIGVELQQHRRSILAGAHEDPLDAHMGLLRLKVAALLAVLDERVDVNLEDWDLARHVVQTSQSVRRWTQGLIDTEGRRKDWAANERAAERAGRIETATLAATASVARVGGVIARHVHRHDSDDPCSLRCVRHAVKSRDRDQFTAALGHAIAAGWIVDVEGHYQRGESRPA